MDELKELLSNIDSVWTKSSIRNCLEGLSNDSEQAATAMIQEVVDGLYQECKKRSEYASNSGSAAFQLEVVERNYHTLNNILKDR